MPTVKQRVRIGAILLCGGHGKRLGIGDNKALVQLAGKPLFLWSLKTLERISIIEGIIVVGPVQRLQAVLGHSKARFPKIVAWCESGPTRQASVALGLQVLPAEFTVVAVHDSARPLVSSNLVKQVVHDALVHGAAIPAVPLNDTLKEVAGQTVSATVPRANLWRAQTPQVFRRDWFEKAYSRPYDQVTDDAELTEALGYKVFITPGEASNIKITTPQDLQLAETLLTQTKPPNL